eukprot:Nk52_evm14s2118 gene=Nk52_evmTU14s2118
MGHGRKILVRDRKEQHQAGNSSSSTSPSAQDLQGGAGRIPSVREMGLEEGDEEERGGKEGRRRGIKNASGVRNNNNNNNNVTRITKSEMLQTTMREWCTSLSDAQTDNVEKFGVINQRLRRLQSRLQEKKAEAVRLHDEQMREKLKLYYQRNGDFEKVTGGVEEDGLGKEKGGKRKEEGEEKLEEKEDRGGFSSFQNKHSAISELGLRHFARHVQEENQELKDTLQEYERAVDVIMTKYRAQINTYEGMNTDQTTLLQAQVSEREAECRCLQQQVIELRARLEEGHRVMALAAYTEEMDSLTDVTLMEGVIKENFQLKQLLGMAVSSEEEGDEEEEGGEEEEEEDSSDR